MDLNQSDPMLPPSPGYPGSFRCGICGSIKVVVRMAETEGAFHISIVCKGCGNALPFVIPKEKA